MMPTLKTDAANLLYLSILDYLIIADDPQYQRLRIFRNKILKLENLEDKKEVIKYFEAETGSKMDYYNSPY